MGYLDGPGLSVFWNKVKSILSGKQDTLIAGSGISLQDRTVSVATPVKGLTQSEYNALSDEEKKAGLYVVTDLSINPDVQGNTYSTEETRVGTWIDGRPIYRKVYWIDAAISGNSYVVGPIENIDIPIKAYGMIVSGYDESMIVASDMEIRLSVTKDGRFVAYSTSNAIFTKIKYAVIEYTKTTDVIPVSTLSFGLPVETTSGPSEEDIEDDTFTGSVLTATSAVHPSASLSGIKFASASASSAGLKFASASASSAGLKFAPVSASSVKVKV